MALEPSAKSDDDGGNDQGSDSCGYQSMRFPAGPLPFMEYPPPHGAEDNDASHMQSPTGETELAHLAFPHCVEEELKVPRRSRQCRKEIVA